MNDCAVTCGDTKMVYQPKDTDFQQGPGGINRFVALKGIITHKRSIATELLLAKCKVSLMTGKINTV